MLASIMTESARHFFFFFTWSFQQIVMYLLSQDTIDIFSLHMCYISLSASQYHDHQTQFFIRLCYIYLLSEDTTYWWFCIRDVCSVLANVMTIRHSFSLYNCLPGIFSRLSYLSVKEGSLLVLFVCLFATLRSSKLWCLLPHSWYHWKALNE